MSEAMCCPLGACGDPPSESMYSFPVADVDTKCEECRATIRSGTKHELYEYTNDDGYYEEGEDEKAPDDMQDTRSWSEARTCMLCQEIRDHFSCGNGYIIGRLWSDLEENFFPDMKAGGPCMDGLSPAAKALLFEERLKWVFEHDEYEPCDRALPPAWQASKDASLRAEVERGRSKWAEFQRAHPQVALPESEEP